MNGWNSLLQDLNYEDRLHVHHMEDNGAPKELIYFWYNIAHGSYNSLPSSVLATDVEGLKIKFPDWAQEIDNWLLKNGREKDPSR